MKSKTIAIMFWLGVGLIACTLLINMAVSMFGDSQDRIILEQKRLENY